MAEFAVVTIKRVPPKIWAGLAVVLTMTACPHVGSRQSAAIRRWFVRRIGRQSGCGLAFEARNVLSLTIHYRNTLEPGHLFQVADPCHDGVARAQRELDLALADGLLQPLRNALPEPVDSALWMSLGRAERANHLCTDVVYRRRSGKPFGFKRYATLKAVFEGMAEREGFLSSSPEHLENGSKISVFRTTWAGCVYRQYVPEPVSHLRRNRADGKRFPPSCTLAIANCLAHQ